MEGMTVTANSPGTYKGKPSLMTEMQVGNTLFTVISVQSEHARETAYDKVRKLILAHASDATEDVSDNLHKIAV